MDLKLPELGEGVHEGELVKWLVKPGDQMKDDQPVCEIMTDKATVELPSPFTGKVTALMAKEGSVVKVGQTILTFEGTSSQKGVPQSSTHSTLQATPQVPQTSAPPLSPQVQAQPQATITVASTSSTFSGASGSGSAGLAVAAAPSTRRYAREMGVNLSQIVGTGPSGRVMREDVDRALGGIGAIAAGSPSLARAPMPVLRREERIPFRGLRKKISEKMRLSKDKAAHFTYVEEADATELVKLRSAAKEIGAAQNIKVTYLPFIMKAMVAALRKYPILNSALDETNQEIVQKYYYNIGLSVQTEDGLTAPVVKDVAHKSVLELAREIQDLVDRARHKKLTSQDLQDSTITLTNAGSIGGLFATPVINFPEVAILGFNKIARKPTVVNVAGREEIVIRDWTLFSISLDHRIVDGAVAAEFMKEFIRYIENPSLMLLEQL